MQRMKRNQNTLYKRMLWTSLLIVSYSVFISHSLWERLLIKIISVFNRFSLKLKVLMNWFLVSTWMQTMQVLSYSKEMNRNVTTKVNFAYKLKSETQKKCKKSAKLRPSQDVSAPICMLHFSHSLSLPQMKAS